MHTLGVLLAGGRGVRLGAGMPKALAMCAGRTLLDRALATLTACCDEVVVVAPAELALPVPAAMRLDDPPGGGGPLPAIAVALRARKHGDACVLAVDLPLVSEAALKGLLALRGESSAVVPRPGGVAQPLAAWYLATAAAWLVESAEGGERSVSRAVEALRPRWVNDEELAVLHGGPGAWLNVNTAENLAIAELLLIEEGR